jgi:hypothetical protein
MKQIHQQRPRCNAGSDLWHFTSECAHWPTHVYAAEDEIPADAKICSECSERAATAEAA